MTLVDTQKKTRGRTLTPHAFSALLQTIHTGFGTGSVCAGLTTLCEIVLPLIVRTITNAGINDPASLPPHDTFDGRPLSFAPHHRHGRKLLHGVGGAYYGLEIETDMRRDLFEHLQSSRLNSLTTPKSGRSCRASQATFSTSPSLPTCPEEFL